MPRRAWDKDKTLRWSGVLPRPSPAGAEQQGRLEHWAMSVGFDKGPRRKKRATPRDRLMRLLRVARLRAMLDPPSGAELARMLGVSLRTTRRDIALLKEAGEPFLCQRCLARCQRETRQAIDKRYLASLSIVRPFRAPDVTAPEREEKSAAVTVG